MCEPRSGGWDHLSKELSMDAHLQPVRLRALFRHAIPHLVEATLIPLALFYASLWLIGVWGALLVALGWSYLALARRLLLDRRVPGLLILGVIGLTVRTAIAIASGSVFVYFLQPTLGSIAVA